MKSCKGAVFVTVSMILSVVLLLLGFLLSVTSSDIRASRNYSDGIKAYYIAQSGAEMAMAHALQNQAQDLLPGIKTVNFLDTVYTDEHSVEWSIDYNDSDSTYTINSTSIYKDRISKKLKVLISIDGSDRITIREWKLE